MSKATKVETKKVADKKESTKKAEPVSKGIVQPKKDEAQTQEAAKANAKAGEPVHTPLGTEVLKHGIESELGQKK